MNMPPRIAEMRPGPGIGQVFTEVKKTNKKLDEIAVLLTQIRDSLKK